MITRYVAGSTSMHYVSGKSVEGRQRSVPVDRILTGLRLRTVTPLRNGLYPSTEQAVKNILWLCVGTEAFDDMEEHEHAVRVLKLWKRVYGQQGWVH